MNICAAYSIACMSLAGGAPPAPGTASDADDRRSRGDYVVLLHGSGRTSLSMKRLEWRLTEEGYRVINETYPSWRTSVESLATEYLPCLLARTVQDHTAKVHFVTHSLGGIIVRRYLDDHQLPNLGRVVILGPPNHGSEIVDHLRAIPIARTVLGSSRLALGTRMEDIPQRLGPVRFPCGVIAGDRTLNPILAGWLTGPNDGKVTVESAKVEGMRDFLVVHSSHTWMMWREQILGQISHFLAEGNFRH